MKRTFNMFSLAIIFSLLFSAVGLSLIPAQAAGAWVHVGPAGFSSAEVFDLSIAFDSGIPYVAFDDVANSHKASVMKFNALSGNWVNVGPAGFSSGGAIDPFLGFDNGVPYVAYSDSANSGKVSVMKFDGINWANVGTAGFSGGGVFDPSLAFDNGTPYVAFLDGAKGYKVSVMKFNGTNWVSVGTAGFAGGGSSFSTAIAFDNGTPYVAFQDVANKANVMKFNGTSWVSVGIAGFSSGAAYYTSLAFDNGTPYVAFQDVANGSKASVMKFDASSGNWVNVGIAGFTNGMASYISVAFDSGMPYVAFEDVANGYKASVMKFDASSGNWVNVGTAGFSAGGAQDMSFAFDSGTPYVAFQDVANNYKASVMKFAGESSPTCYALTTAHTGQGSNPTASPANSTGCPAGQFITGAAINLSGGAPNSGWQIAGWTGTNNDSSTASTNTLTMPASARTVNVNYTQIEYTLTITSTHGTVTKNPNQTTYHYGDIVQLTAAPATGWTFANWTGDATSTSNPVSVTINGNKAVTANYTQNCYALTLSHAGQGGNPAASPAKSTACSTNGQYVYGAAISLSGASPSGGWQIGSWTGTANDSSTAAINSLTMPASTRTVSVNYTQIGYTLTTSSAHGTVTKSPDKATYTYGEVVQLTAAPAAGWSFVNWTGDVTGATNPVSVTINGNKAVTANYAQIEYTLGITSAHGTVTKNPDKATYHYGDVVQLTAVPAVGWYFANWTGDATGASNPVSITINGNKAVTANYTQTGYTLTITSAHGNVTKSPDKATYNFGDVVQLTAAPATGWSFANWGGDATGVNNPVSITIDGNKAVTANYTQNQNEYSLAITSAHGTVTKNPDKAAYNYGDVVQLTAKAAPGWMFDNWSGDATGTANPVSVTMNGNKSISANYVRSGADTTGVFRPTNGALYLKNQNETGYADVQINYGLAGDYPIVGDWDGDGDATIGIYRNGSFYLRNENTIGYADIVFLFGLAGDQPVAGDWDGDGIDTIGVYRNGLFLLRNSNDAGPADASFALGMAGDVGIAGDWNGDGKDTTGVFRPSNGALYLKDKNETGYADIQINYGLPGDKPVTGDWNNDGIDTIGVYRNGQFMLRNTNTIGFAEWVFALGVPGDMPIAGNWDGLP